MKMESQHSKAYEIQKKQLQPACEKKKPVSSQKKKFIFISRNQEIKATQIQNWQKESNNKSRKTKDVRTIKKY